MGRFSNIIIKHVATIYIYKFRRAVIVPLSEATWPPSDDGGGRGGAPFYAPAILLNRLTEFNRFSGIGWCTLGWFL